MAKQGDQGTETTRFIRRVLIVLALASVFYLAWTLRPVLCVPHALRACACREGWSATDVLRKSTVAREGAKQGRCSKHGLPTPRRGWPE